MKIVSQSSRVLYPPDTLCWRCTWYPTGTHILVPSGRDKHNNLESWVTWDTESTEHVLYVISVRRNWNSKNAVQRGFVWPKLHYFNQSYTFKENSTITINLTLNLKRPWIIDLRPWPLTSGSIKVFYTLQFKRSEDGYCWLTDWQGHYSLYYHGFIKYLWVSIFRDFVKNHYFKDM